jgi:geranylgeranyl diphosphate synthase, type II
MISVIHNTEELLQQYDNYAALNPFPQCPRGIYDAARHIMNIKGKRIRPLLVLHSCDMFEGRLEKALGAAHAVEVFHNFTLVHDDIMDNASLRRGEKTVHEVFGNNVAILAGDVMLSLAYQYLVENNEDCLAELIQVFNKTGVEVMEGQQWDVDFETRMNVSEEEYIQMIQYKTSVLLACSVKLGAIIAGASKEDQENMYQFGLNLGLAFQIKDDYLDSFGEGDKVGKRIGGDILNNKKTLLLITALRKSEGKDKEELLALLNEQDENKKIANIKTLFIKMGVKEYAEEKMQTLFTKSLNYLSKVNADTDRKKSLATFAEKVYYREF